MLAFVGLEVEGLRARGILGLGGLLVQLGRTSRRARETRERERERERWGDKDREGKREI